MTRFTPLMKSLLGATALATLGLTAGAVSASAAPSTKITPDRVEHNTIKPIQTAQLSEAARKVNEKKNSTYRSPVSRERDASSNNSSSNSSRSTTSRNTDSRTTGTRNSGSRDTTTRNTGNRTSGDRNSQGSNTRTTTTITTNNRNSDRNSTNRSNNSNLGQSWANALRSISNRTATYPTNNSSRSSSNNRNSNYSRNNSYNTDRHSTSNFRFGSTYRPTRTISQSFGRYIPSSWNNTYRGYSTSYRSGFGISFNFGTSGYSQYRWAPSQYGLYRSNYGSYYGYQSQTQCQRIYIDGIHNGRLTPISVTECYNPWDGHYIIQGTERVEYSYHY